MHPELFKFNTPDFLTGLLPNEIVIYSYGALILIGVLAAFSYLKKYAYQDFGLSEDTSQSLLMGLIIMSVVGGKFFMIFENPSYYLSNPKSLISNSGFVFYGSLIFSMGFVVWFIKKHQLSTWKFLDLIGFVAIIVHFFGRLGCFMAGCCHGIESHGPFAVTFNDPLSQAHPLGVPLHPTQLYSSFMLASIFLILTLVRKRQQFAGQLFLLYLILYSTGRSIIEEFRGDEARGFLFDGWYSNSQFISTVIITFAIIAYVLQYRKSKTKG
ncbi:prolipoprotein diacylglyceryl transferase [bacterium SCSIO 12643]|nr:prolipoprotein diacylglyceryl transferase [bacterium SCSIO 12643]